MSEEKLYDYTPNPEKSPIDQNDTILEVRNVRQYFKIGVGRNKVVVKAVHNINFNIKRGEVFGLVGESGCGKTTTGRSIIKLYDITDGEIFFKGVRTSVGFRTYTDNILICKKAKASLKQIAKKYLANPGTILGIAALGLQELNKNLDNQTLIDENIKRRKEMLSLEEELVPLKEKYDQLITSQKAKSENKETVFQDEVDQLNDLKQSIKEKINVIIEIKEKELETIINYSQEWIKIGKRDNVRDPEIMSSMQMIFQDPIDSLDPRLTVNEIISEGMIINGERDKELMRQKVEDALKLVGLLPDHASRYPHEFSGGQRQRIGIARALVINPEFIIADEPISALDVSIQAQVINLLNDLRNQFQLTIMFIAHNLSVVKYFCDRIGVMYYGRLVEVATAEELFAHPLHPYTKSLLSAVPLPDPDYEKSRKRIFYNPRLRPRTDDKPLMTEIVPGHFVYASMQELDRYRRELNGEEVEPDPTLTTAE